MNKQIERATWEESIEYSSFDQDARNNNIIVGIAVGFMIAVCGIIYVVMSLIS